MPQNLNENRVHSGELRKACMRRSVCQGVSVSLTISVSVCFSGKSSLMEGCPWMNNTLTGFLSRWLLVFIRPSVVQLFLLLHTLRHTHTHSAAQCPPSHWLSPQQTSASKLWVQLSMLHLSVLLWSLFVCSCFSFQIVVHFKKRWQGKTTRAAK